MWTVPNILTMIRILMIPVFVILFYVPADHWDFVSGKLSFHWIDFTAALIYGISCLTDLADGYIARKYNLCSKFGAFLDPVADKLTVTTALVLIVERFCNSDILHGYTWIITIPAITIIGREIAITALREWMAEIGKRTEVAVSWIGKWKNTFQMVPSSQMSFTFFSSFVVEPFTAHASFFSSYQKSGRKYSHRFKRSKARITLQSRTRPA